MHQTFVKLAPTMLFMLTFLCFAAGTPARAAGDPTLGDKCHPPGQARCGDPINLYTGEVFSEITDYETAGPNKLAFKRYYNPASGNDGVFGFAEWTSNFDANLFIYSSSEVDLFMADGKYVPIYLQNGIWRSFTDMDLRLTLSGSTWMLTDWDDNVTTFTGTAVGSNLRPTSLRARNGYTQMLQYDTSGRLVSVTDSYGRTLTLSYNGYDVKVSNVTTPDGLVLSYSYPSSGSTFLKLTYSTNPPTTQSYQYDTSQTYFPRLLSGVVDEDGNQLSSWTYDSSRHATSSQNAGGADLWTIGYNSDGTRTLTNALGQQEVYKFAAHVGSPIAKLSEIDRLPTSTTAAATRKFTYDSNGYIASQTDWNGDQTTFVNNAQGLPTMITEAAGTQQQRVTSITYHATFRLPTQIVTPGLTTSFAYDGNGNLLSRTETDTTTTTWPYSTNGQARTWTYAWGSNFLLVSVADPRGDTTQFGYDASGTLSSITNALGQVTQITQHTGGGLPLTVVDPNGVVTNFAYDARQRLTNRTVNTAAGPLTTTYSHDAAGNLTQVTLPDGSALANTYDAAHRLVATADRFGQQIQYALDALGDRTQTNLLNSAGTVDRHHSATFDALGRMLEDIGGVGQITGFAYDSNGNRTTITDPLGRVRSQTFDALDHLTHITDPAGGTTNIAYDAHDHPISVTDPNGNATQYVYDGFGDVIASISPDAGTTVFYYDATGNLVQRVDARGAVTNFAYDALNRLLSRTYPGGSGENTNFTYDEPGAGFGIGRLTTVIDNGGHAGGLKLSYDERGNLVSAVRTAGAVTLTTAYAYDAASRIAAITYPSGWSVAYTRDQMGRVSAIAAQPPGPAPPPARRLDRPALGFGLPPANPAVVSAVTYLPFGPVSGLTYGNGIIETRGFDLDYRPTALTDAGAATMQSLTYSYNAANNVTAIADGVTPGNSQSFAYDALDRLVAASGGYGSLAYAYDPVGNLLSRAANDGYQSATVNFSYAAGSNRLTALVQGGIPIRQFSYTASGSIASDLKLQAGVWVGNDLEYNQGGRLAAAVNEAAFGKSAQSTSYAYDAFGQRLLKQGPQGLRFYQYDPAGHLLEEGSLANGSATPERDYVYLGDRPVAMLLPATGAFFFLHGDRLDTPQLATDAAERAQWTANYQPFGAIRPVILNLAQNLRFPGQYADPETGYHHNGFRDYAVDLGRYLQSDPIGLLGGLNTYVYAMSNPINARDPSGLLKIPGTDIDIPIDIDIGHDGVKAKPQDPLSTINKEYGDPAAAATLRAQIEAEHRAYEALVAQLNARRFDRCTPAWIKNALVNALNSIAQQYDNDVEKYNNWKNRSTNIPPIQNQNLPYPGHPVPGLPTPNAYYR